MRSWRNGHKLRFALLGLSVGYPFVVYFTLGHVPPGALVLGLLALLALRLVFVRAPERHGASMAPLLWLTGGALLVLLAVAASPAAALKSYPVLVSLGFAAVFGYSLLRPPTIVERIARLGDPALPASAVPYLRNVTLAWLIFFLANAAISIATAVNGDLALWTLYNGFISYVIMGALFAGELAIRYYRRPGRTEA
jgi:uncharacterized membrane protein